MIGVRKINTFNSSMKQDLRKHSQEQCEKLSQFLEKQKKLLNIPVSGRNGLGSYINNNSKNEVFIKDASLGHYIRASQWPSDPTRKAIASAFGFTLEQFDYFLENKEVTEEEAKNYQINWQNREDSKEEVTIDEFLETVVSNPDKRKEFIEKTLDYFTGNRDYQDEFVRESFRVLREEYQSALMLQLLSSQGIGAKT